jgi:hypothetical protein
MHRPRATVIGAVVLLVGTALASAAITAAARVDPLRDAATGIVVLAGLAGLATVGFMVASLFRTENAGPVSILATTLAAVGLSIGYVATVLSWPAFQVAIATASRLDEASPEASGYCVSTPNRSAFWYVQAEARSAPLIGFFVGRGQVIPLSLRRPGQPAEITELRHGDRFEVEDDGVMREAELVAVDESGLLERATTRTTTWSCEGWREVRAPLDTRHPLDWFLGTNRPFRVVPTW